MGAIRAFFVTATTVAAILVLATLLFSTTSCDPASKVGTRLGANVTSNVTRGPSSFRRYGIPRASIALGIQGNARFLKKWRTLFSALHTDDRERFKLFLYVYGEGVSGLLDDFLNSDVAGLLADVSTPATRAAAALTTRQAIGSAADAVIADTWTIGRNSLARLIYAFEVKRGAQFSWWAMADADMSRLTCLGCGTAPPNNAARSACCMMHAFVAAETLPFASVATTPFVSDPADPITRLFHQTGRVDAQFQVFHRRAVPVLLPYHEDLDKVSWWISQHLVQLYSLYCLPGAVVGLTLTVRSEENSHASYPRQDYPIDVVTDVMRKHHPVLASRFLDGKGSGACVAAKGGAPPAPSGTKVFWYPENVVPWQASDEFACCLAERGPNFIALVGGGVPEAPPY